MLKNNGLITMLRRHLASVFENAANTFENEIYNEDAFAKYSALCECLALELECEAIHETITHNIRNKSEWLPSIDKIQEYITAISNIHFENDTDDSDSDSDSN